MHAPRGHIETHAYIDLLTARFPAGSSAADETSDRVFRDAEQREINGGADRTNAAFRFYAYHQDADDLESVVAVARHSDFGATHVGDVHDRAGGGIVLFGIDDTYCGLRIAVEEDGEAFHLSL